MTGRPDAEASGGGIRVVTFGCRLNSFESEVMREHAQAAGLDDVVIVNTCAVTAEAERQARQAIRKLRRDNPTARIIVTGCAAQIDPAAYAAMPEVDRVLGNAEKMRPESYAEAIAPRVAVAATAELKETARHLIGGFDGRARAFVEIQQGCDHACTFCIIPSGRGPNRSATPEAIVAQMRKLVGSGFNEVVLTGVDICSYGRDATGLPGLGALVRTLLAEVPDLPRLRLTSLDPAAVDDELLALVAEEPRLMPHFHLSIQAGDDLVLKRMRRRHSRGQAITLARRLKELRPGCAVGADLIAGFPTESDEMAERSAALIAEAGLTHLHVFPYSPRPGTPAARMPQVSRAVAKVRAARLRTLGNEAMAAFLAEQVGHDVSVLVEKDGFGHSEHYLPVRIASPDDLGRIVRVRVTSASEGHLMGEA